MSDQPADIQSMLPHRKPMLMLTSLLEYNNDSLSAAAVIEADNPLLHNGQLPAHATLELIAQASGLFLGLNGEESNGPGAIVSVRNMQVYDALIETGTMLSIDTRCMGRSGQAAMFNGRVHCNQETVLTATLTVSSFPTGDRA